MNLLTGVAGRVTAAGSGGLLVGMGYLAPIFATWTPRDLVFALLLGLGAAAGMLLWRARARARAFIVVTAFIAALLIALLIPLAKDGYPEVRITATGQKNPKSNSSEVFARLVSAPVQGLQRLRGPGWEERGDVSVSYQQQPATLHYNGAWSSGASLRLVRHGYSGIAEVSIGGKTQRLDLFSDKEDYIDVALPEAAVSWTGYLQRAAIVAGLGVLFTAIGLPLASASAAWGAVLALALLAGCGTLWLVKDDSYAGSLEVVAFVASSAPARIELDAGHGFTPALSAPVKSGAAISEDFVLPNPAEWKLAIEGGELRMFRNLDSATMQASRELDNGCPIAFQERCVYEVQGTGPLRIWLRSTSDPQDKIVKLPAPSAEGERLFLRLVRQPGRIAVSASRAYVQLSPWEHFSRWIIALRVIDRDGKPAGDVLRLQSEGIAGYRVAQTMDGAGTHKLPTLVRPDTGSFVGMKIFTALISVSFVLMVAAAVVIARDLTLSFSDRRRPQVLACVLGCFVWLGVATAVGWPAIIGWDGLSPYIQAQTGAITLWYGIGYPLIVGGFLLMGSGALVTVWSILGTAVLLLGTAALLLRHSSEKASWVAPTLFCVVLPFTVVMVGMMTHLRDAMNGLMLAMFAFCSFYAALRWDAWPRFQRAWILVGLLIAGAVVALLRIDNLPTLLILAAGLVLRARRFNVRGLALLIIAAVCWIGIGPLAERVVLPNSEGAAVEKRLYASTALINPLTGMLVYGKERLPETLYAEIFETLDKVMNASIAIQQWSPYNVIYWHETIGQREVPSIEVNAQLRRLYLRAMQEDPILFMKLRMATFSAMLGHTWFDHGAYGQTNESGHPSFHDHLLTNNRNWQHLTELFGYPPTAHRMPLQTQGLLAWEGRVASTLLQLLLCIAVALRFRRSPFASVVAIGEIVRAGVFFLFAPASVFLYLYDLHLLGFLLPMMVLAEESMRADTATCRSPR